MVAFFFGSVFFAGVVFLFWPFAGGFEAPAALAEVLGVVAFLADVGCGRFFVKARRGGRPPSNAGRSRVRMFRAVVAAGGLLVKQTPTL